MNNDASKNPFPENLLMLINIQLISLTADHTILYIQENNQNNNKENDMQRSLLSYFISEEIKPTRLQKCTLIKTFFTDLEALRTQADALKKDVDQNGATTLAFQKYTILSSLVKTIDDEIKTFNKNEEKSGLKEIKEVVALLEKLDQLVKPIITNDQTLNQDRKTPKYTIRSRVTNTAGATVATASLLSGVGVIGTFFLSVASMLGTEKIIGDWNIFDRNTTSYKLLKNLDTTISTLINNLNYYIKLNFKADDIANAKLERTWGAICLNMHPIFKKLPLDAKALILSNLNSEFENEPNQDPKAIQKHEIQLFNRNKAIVIAADEMLKKKLPEADKNKEAPAEKSNIRNNNNPF